MSGPVLNKRATKMSNYVLITVEFTVYSAEPGNDCTSKSGL